MSSDSVDTENSARPVLVVGARGQLGALSAERWARRRPVLAFGRAELDLGDHEAVMRAVTGARPAIILNCAAYNNVDGAESDPLAALTGNTFAVRSLARAAAEIGAVLVHYSTDFVFDGEASTPYTELDEPRPQSVYGASKLLGEWFALQSSRSYVLRVESLFGGPAPRSSVDKIIDALLAGREAPVFVDRVVSPSFVDDVAAATEQLLATRAAFGLYHCVNDGAASWDELALELARIAGVDAKLKRLKMADVALIAKRPRYCALSNGKLRQAGVVMPRWQDAMRRYFEGRRAAVPPQ